MPKEEHSKQRPQSTDGWIQGVPTSITKTSYLTSYIPKATVQSLSLHLNHPAINQMTFCHLATASIAERL